MLVSLKASYRLGLQAVSWPASDDVGNEESIMLRSSDDSLTILMFCRLIPESTLSQASRCCLLGGLITHGWIDDARSS
jgi:hypothetical protein